jgi:hypothetical protein
MMLDKLDWWPISEAAKKIGTEESMILLMADQGLFTLYARVGANDDIQGNEVFVKDTALEDASLFGESVNAKKYLGLSPLPPALLNGESIEIHSGLDPDDEDRIVLFRYLNPMPQRVRDEVKNGRPLQIVHLGFIDDITGDTDIIDSPLDYGSYEFASITVTPKNLYIRKSDAVKHMIDSSVGDTDNNDHKKLSPSGKHQERCKAIAQWLWSENPDLLKSEIAKMTVIKEIGCEGKPYGDRAIKDWLKEIQPEVKTGCPKTRIVNYKLSVEIK